jgi:AcrR family transcriptional regulator
MSKEERKQKVLAAASICFAKYGFEKTTLDDIGKVVGLNKASLYYYYKNKESIFCDVILNEADIYIKELQRKVKNLKSAEHKILTYLGERINYYRKVVNLHNLSLI